MKLTSRLAPARRVTLSNADAGGARHVQTDRRSDERVHTLFRIAHLISATDSGLCRVHNISDEGMMVSTALDLQTGVVVEVRLSDRTTLLGEAAWKEGSRVGLRFSQPLDCAALLQSLATEHRCGGRRAPRLEVQTMGLAITELGLQVIRVLNISQTGMKIAHDGRLRRDDAVRVRLENGIERRAVVIWSEGGLAGVRLLNSLPYDCLQSANNL